MKIYCDGGARGNPGPGASAFVVYDGEQKTHEDSKFLGHTTNNVAEYSALIMALEWAVENASSKVEIVLDSELVKKQMTGEYRIKDPKLQALAASASALIRKTQGVTFSHTLRAGNARADALVNETLDRNF